MRQMSFPPSRTFRLGEIVVVVAAYAFVLGVMTVTLLGFFDLW